jgi:AcrR family transcriptional regulator
MKPRKRPSTVPTRAARLKQAIAQRREQQRENLRRTILTAAGELCLAHGYEGFSLRQVAERIGYSATTIYRYFANKDDLLFAIVYEGFNSSSAS